MANRKDEEKNERIIRSLLKLPDNRRCINCKSLGPQYVCTNFWTFVCTTCSGIHREFTHRVKSVSMAKFSSQEVSALQGGGNASAKEIYLKEWDAQRNSFPDSSNVERLRDFIKHVYVDRRYTGERNFDKPPRVKMGEEDFNEKGSRSPPFEDTYGCRSSDRPSPGRRSDEKNYRTSYDERRSPGYGQENRPYGDYRKSPARTEIVNDWRRDDRFGNGRRSEDSSISDGGSKLEGRSPDRERDLDMSSPPMIRPVRDILGENVSPLRVIEPPKANGGRSTDGSVRTQRTASSSSLASSSGNSAEIRMESSLIDFDAVPETSVTASGPASAQIAVGGMSIAQPVASSNVDNWANFDSASELKLSQARSNTNPLESVLSELLVPASVPGTGGTLVTAPVGNMSAFPSSNSTDLPVGQMSVLPFRSATPAAGAVSTPMAFFPDGSPAVTPRPVSVLPIIDENSFVSSEQWPVVQPQQPSLFPANGSQPTQPTAQRFIPVVGAASSNQPWNLSRGPSSSSASQVSQASKPAVEVSAGVVPQSVSVEVKSSGRKALPEDLFAPNYSSIYGPVPRWQTGPPHGIGFTMQYNIAAHMPTFPQSSKSTNPFEISNEPSPVQGQTFPSMASLQGALPNMAAPTGLMRTSSLGTPSSTWMPPQPSHPIAMLPHPPTYPSAMPSSSYMGQQVPTNMASRQPGVASFGHEGAAFGTLNPTQQLSGLYSAPATLNTFSSVGGNPFG